MLEIDETPGGCLWRVLLCRNTDVTEVVDGSRHSLILAFLHREMRIDVCLSPEM